MGLGRLLQPALLLLFFCTTQCGAYTEDCYTMDYYISTSHNGDAQYFCMITEDSYTNWDQLKRFEVFAKENSVSLYDIARSSNHCADIGKEWSGAWQIWCDECTGPNSFQLECSKEFLLISSMEALVIIKPVKTPTEYTVKGRVTVASAERGGIWIHTSKCTGKGKVTVSKGAGVDEAETKYLYRSWGCSSMPDWIITFDNVVTIEATGDTTLTMDISSDVSATLRASPGEKIIVLTSGRDGNMQSLSPADQHNVNFSIGNGNTYEVDVSMDLTFDNEYDTKGFVKLRESTNETAKRYQSGVYAEKFVTDYFGVSYRPEPHVPIDINPFTDTSEDHVIIEISIGYNAATTTTPKTTTTRSATTTRAVTTTAPSRPIDQGPYCNCDVDKFGFASGWNYNDIWVDVVVVLDASEAMGQTALNDAAELVESFISDGFDDLLITETKAPFYTRVGVISISDKSEVLYDLNMTKVDKVKGKVSIKNGVKEISVVDAFNAAVDMLNDGLKSQPDRKNTRQVIYYMTDSDENETLQSLDQFKSSGVVIVNNFLQDGEVERPNLRKLASDGYYYSTENYMLSLQAFCKANCFCQPELISYGGSDPALQASGGCYKPTYTPTAFNNAKSSCAEDNGIVATVHDEEKNEFLSRLMTSTKSDYFWIGYKKSDDGVWIWEDQSSNPYTNWDAGEPSDSSVANCTYVDTSTSPHMWGAAKCQVGFLYACQYTPCSVGHKDC